MSPTARRISASLALAIGLGCGTGARAETGTPSWLNGLLVAPEQIPKTDLPMLQTTLGLLSPDQAGLWEDPWGDTSALRLRRLIDTHRDSPIPQARALFQRLMLLRSPPARGSADGEGLLRARIDALLRLGALDPAEALLAEAGMTRPELFRRGLAVGLLTGRVEAACAALARTAVPAASASARAYCLARAGDWSAAHIIASTGEAVGQLSTIQAHVLTWFLDPSSLEGTPPPPLPPELSVLDFTLRDAVGLPRPRGLLPLAFEHVDLDDGAPVRARIEAGERLAVEGAIAPTTLFQAYRAGTPAASGGIWDRAQATQDLDRSLAEEDPLAIATAVRRADHVFSRRGLRNVFAQEYGDKLATVPRRVGDTDFRAEMFELLLLSGNTNGAWRWGRDAPTPQDRLLLALTGPAGALPDRTLLELVERQRRLGPECRDPPLRDRALSDFAV
ncbi:MAG: hypothetical protein AAFR93_07920 [Pseudomonadota bacterium]